MTAEVVVAVDDSMEADVVEIFIAPDGTCRYIYGEAVDLTPIGALQIERASHVEPDAAGQWWADLSPVGGPTLGPFIRRSEALAAEIHWLRPRVACLTSRVAAEHESRPRHDAP